ncbi:MAG TPA: hypothetical protein VNB64_06295, partial [Solirubrobacteraceae bacterium]|nr:hypothetical protein [Solirubrobacteraceae bacterium]
AGRVPSRSDDGRPLDRWVVLGAAAAGSVVAVDWLARVRDAFGHGMPNPDTLWYHMPYAARFVQDGSLHALDRTQPDSLTAFYPANAELLHAVPLLLLGHDTLSPLINLAWLGLVLLAAWCVGRRFGTPATALLAACVAVGGYHMSLQSGDPANDVVGLALFLAAGAIVADGSRDARTFGLAALPAGLAVGTKLSMLAPVVALFAGVLALSTAGTRRRVTLAWGVVVPITGGVWYVRNLIATGNPLPWLKIGVGDLTLPATYDAPELRVPQGGFDSTLVHLLADEAVLGAVRAGLRDGLGPAWWALLAVAGLGLMAGLMARERPVVRVLAAVGLVSFAAYVLTPMSGSFFPWNLRHGIPTLTLGLLVLTLLPALGSVGRQRAVAALLFGLFATSQTGRDLALTSVPRAAVAAGAAAVAVGLALAVIAWPSRARRLAPVALTGLAVAAVGMGYRVHERYLDRRYADTGKVLVQGYRSDAPLRAVFAWARGVRGARIGLIGTEMQYPLYGVDVSNRVRYLHRTRGNGREVRPIRSCGEWARAIAELRLDYVVTTPVRFPLEPDARPPVQERWTRSLSTATETIRAGDHVTVFRIVGPARCR